MIDPKVEKEQKAWATLCEAFDRLHDARNLYGDHPRSEYAGVALTRDATGFTAAAKTWAEAFESYIRNQECERAADAVEGIEWFNALTEVDRAQWLIRAGVGSSAANAWSLYKHEKK